MFRARAVPALVDPAAVKARGFMEIAEIGHVHCVGRGPVVGVGAAEHGVDAEVGDERLGMGEALGLRQERDGLGLVAVDLGDVEDRVCPGENAAGRTVLLSRSSSPAPVVSFHSTTVVPRSPLRTWVSRACHCRWCPRGRCRSGRFRRRPTERGR